MEISHIKESSLYVKDLQRSFDFYHLTLGFEVISFVENRHVFFRAGKSVLLCFLAEVTKNENKLPPHFGSGQLHLAFEVSETDFGKWKEKITSAGMEILHEQEWKQGKTSFYFRDPDDHLLEILPPGVWE